jgi:hypothetical protein
VFLETFSSESRVKTAETANDPKLARRFLQKQKQRDRFGHAAVHTWGFLRPESFYKFLHVVVEEEFVRMRAEAQRVMFFALVADPHFEEVRGEHISLQEEVMILLEII